MCISEDPRELGYAPDGTWKGDSLPRRRFRRFGPVIVGVLRLLVRRAEPALSK
jgi:hypothetical protein